MSVCVCVFWYEEETVRIALNREKNAAVAIEPFGIHRESSIGAKHTTRERKEGRKRSRKKVK